MNSNKINSIKEYNLSYGKIVPETRKLTRCFGECSPCDKCYNAEHIDERNCREKILSIRVHQLDKPHISLARGTILRTLAHELTHLQEWDHGPGHRVLEKEIRQYIKDLGYDI